MRFKLFPILLTIIVPGFAVFAITANEAFAASIDIQQTMSSGLSSLTQSTTQTSSVPSGTSTSTSSNQLVVDSNNQGHAVSSATASDLAAGLIGLSNIANAGSSLTQSTTQTSSVPSGTSTSTSSNQLVVDSNNQGHAVSSATASDLAAGLIGLSNIASGLSSLTQRTSQTTTCTSGGSSGDLCHQLLVNFNQGNTLFSSIASDLAAGLIGLSNIANAGSSLTQSTTQTSSVPSGTSTSTSSNQLVVDSNNQGHAVSSLQTFSGP